MKGGCKSLKPPCFPVSSVGNLTDPKCQSLPPVLKKQKSSHLSYSEAETIVNDKDVIQTRPLRERLMLSEYDAEIIEPMRQQIRSGVPLLDQRNIRRVRLRFYNSVLEDLKEDGYSATAEYIQYLVELDESQRAAVGRMNPIFSRPNLVHADDVLEKLVEGFKKGDINNDPAVLLKVAVEFVKEDNRNWYWLVDDIFKKAVDVACKDKMNEKMQAIALHVQAEFLLEKLGKVQEAEVQLLKSMKLSSVHMWTTKELFGKASDLLYLDSCYLLHKAYLKWAREVQDSDIHKCIEFCLKAVNVAYKTKNEEARENTTLELIDAYIMAEELKHANHHIDKYLVYCRHNKNTKGLCKALLKLSTILLKEEKTREARETLNTVIKYATESKHNYLCAMAHQKLVLLNLQEENMPEARLNAAIAYEIFSELNAHKELEDMRCFFGITLGLETMQMYEKILFNSKDVDDRDFEPFIEWKTARKEFYDNMKLIQPEAEQIALLECEYETVKADEVAFKTRKDTNFSSIKNFEPKLSVLSSLTMPSAENSTHRLRNSFPTSQNSTLLSTKGSFLI